MSGAAPLHENLADVEEMRRRIHAANKHRVRKCPTCEAFIVPVSMRKPRCKKKRILVWVTLGKGEHDARIHNKLLGKGMRVHPCDIQPPRTSL